MKTFLPVLSAIAFAGLMTFPVSIGASIMLIMTAGFGAIILQDYSCRPRLQLRGRRVAARALMPTATEAHRLAA